MSLTRPSLPKLDPGRKTIMTSQTGESIEFISSRRWQASLLQFVMPVHCWNALILIEAVQQTKIYCLHDACRKVRVLAARCNKDTNDLYHCSISCGLTFNITFGIMQRRSNLRQPFFAFHNLGANHLQPVSLQ